MNGGGFVAETDKALGVLRRSWHAWGRAFQAKGRPIPLWLRVRWARHGLASALMACGVVVADEPLYGMVPLRTDHKKGPNQGQLVTQWDGKDIDTSLITTIG